MATPNIEDGLATAFDFEPWLKAKKRFLDQIGDDERTLFDEATVENIFTSTRDANRDDGPSKTRSFSAKIKPLVDAIEDFGDALDVFTSMSPLHIAPIWGSIRVVLVLARKHRKFYERVVDVLGRIGDILPRFRDYQRIFDPQKHCRLMAALSNTYLDIILLCIRIQTLLRDQRHSKLTRVFQPLSPAVNGELENAMANFRNHRKTVEKEAETAHMIEEADAWALVGRNKKASVRQKLLSHLSMLDYEGKQRKIRKLRHSNTGAWLLSSSEYKSWLNSQKSAVFCFYGIPGCGKSVLASSIVDELPVITKSLPKTAAAYHYCDYADKRTLNPINIFGSLARALLQSMEIPDEVENLITASYNDGMRIPETEEVLRILQATMTAHSHIILIIDGLDEASDKDQTVIQRNLKSLLNGYSGILRLFISCREDLTSVFARTFIPGYKMEIRAATISDDIAGYVSYSIDMLLATKDLVLRNQGLRKEIIEALVEGAKGMFLWVKFVIDDLCDAETDDEIRKILRDLPKNLSETYDRLLSRIDGKTRCDFVQKMFQWIACAKRPLMISELQEGIAFHLDDRHWDPTKIPTDMSRLIRACSKLVVVDEESGIVEFAHYTIMQYLLNTETTSISQFHFNLRDANNYVGEVCVAYLCFSDFETQLVQYVDTTTASMREVENVIMNQPLPSPIAAAMKLWNSKRGYEIKPSKIDYGKYLPKAKPPTTEILNKYCLLGYIIENWLLHSVSFWEDPTQRSPASTKRLTKMSTHEILDRLESGWYGHPRRRLLFQDLVLTKRLIFDTRPWESHHRTEKYPQMSALGCALLTNHVPLLASLVSGDSNLRPWQYSEFVGEHFGGIPPEDWSSLETREYLNTVHPRSDTEINALTMFHSQLVTASRLGHSDILRFCLDPKSKSNIHIRHHLLIEAAAYGQESVVTLLCNGETDQAQFTRPFTYHQLNAIERAAVGGHLQLVSYLKDRGHQRLHLDLTDAISDAVGQGDAKAFRALLELELDSTNIKGLTPREEKTWLVYERAIIFAARQNDVASVEKLMTWGLSASVTVRSASVSPLLIAVQHGQYYMLEAILARERFAAHECHNFLAMLWAAGVGDIGMVQFLFEHGFPFSNPVSPELGGAWPTALFVAAANGHERVVQFLLQNGATPDHFCPAVSNLHESVGKLGILDHWKVDKESSPFYAAMLHGHVEIMVMLLREGASIDSQGREDWIFYGSCACFWNSLDAVQTLVTAINSGKSTHTTSIHEAVRDIHERLLYAATSQGSKVFLGNLLRSGTTETCPLLEAIIHGHFGCYKLLRNAGAKTFNKHAIGVITYKRHDILLDMLQNGLDANTRAARESSLGVGKHAPLLVIAASIGDTESVRILLEKGAKIDATDNLSRTALSHAIINDYFPVFQVLYSYHASFSRCDIDNIIFRHRLRKDFLEFMISSVISFIEGNAAKCPFSIDELEQALSQRYSLLDNGSWDNDSSDIKFLGH